MYLIRKDETPTATADLPAGLSRLEQRCLQVPLEGSAYIADNKDLFSKLFSSTNLAIAGPYVKKFSRYKDGRKAYFAIRQHFMGDDAINRAKDKAYTALETAKYRGDSQRFSYETYVLIFEKNMRLLSSNNEEMPDTKAVQNFLTGIEFPRFAAVKAFVNGSDAHKNDFAKTTAYLASFVQHSKGGGCKISAFHATGDGGRHGGRFGHGGSGKGGRGGRGGRSGRGGGNMLSS